MVKAGKKDRVEVETDKKVALFSVSGVRQHEGETEIERRGNQRGVMMAEGERRKERV